MLKCAIMQVLTPRTLYRSAPSLVVSISASGQKRTWCKQPTAQRTGGHFMFPTDSNYGLPPRFWAKVEKTEGCWLWVGSRGYNGYGKVKINGRQQVAHRVAYEAAVGPIPAGYQVDHVALWGCISPSCVRPSHLEAVTPSENIRRSRGPAITGARNRIKTHCPRGHAYDEANTYVSRTGSRSCKACRRLYHPPLREMRRSLGYLEPGSDLTVRVSSDAVSGRGFLFALALEGYDAAPPPAD